MRTPWIAVDLIIYTINLYIPVYDGRPPINVGDFQQVHPFNFEHFLLSRREA